jgi:hypothetical protein
VTQAKSLVISRLIVRVWRNVIWEALGRSTTVLTLMIVFLCVCVAGVEVMIVEVSGPLIAGIQSALGSVGQIDLIRTTFDEIAVTAAVLFTLLSSLSPNLNVLDRNLAVMPVRPWERFVGYLLPTLALVVVGLVLFFAPIAWTAGAVEPGRVWLLTVFGLQILYSVLGTALLQLAIVVVLTRVVGLGEVLARMFGAVAVGLAFLAVLVSDTATTVRTHKSPLSILNVLQPLSDTPTAFHGGLAELSWRLGFTLAVLAVLVLIGLEVVFLARLLVRSDAASLGPLFRSRIVGPRGLGVIVVTAARLAFRHPENRVSALLYLGITLLAATLLAQQGVVNQWSGTAVLLSVAAAASFSINAYGRTQPIRWIFQGAPVGRKMWLVGNALGSLAFGIVAMVAMVAPYYVVGWRFTDASVVLVLLYVFVLTFAWMYAAGVIVPYSDDVPLSSGLVALGALLTGLPAAYLLSRLGLTSPSPSSLLLVLVVIVCACVAVSWGDKMRLVRSGA